MFELEARPARINPWISLLKQQFRRFRRRKQRRPRTESHPFASVAERLEDRALLAGPELVAVLPNVGNFLNDREIRNEAPGELTLRFSPGQTIDPATLGGITVVRSGADGIFGNANDVTITPGFRGIGSSTNEVIVRFADTLVDDQYRISIAGTGANTLRNSNGEAFHAGVNLDFNFELDLGAQITAIVPQPVLRNKVLTVASVAQLTDGDRFTVTAGGVPITFEFDNGGAATGAILANGNTAVAFTGADSTATVAASIQTAINVSGLDVTTALSGSQVTIAGGAYHPTVSTVLATGTAMTVTDGGLTQRQNVVTVYFNNDPLDSTVATNPSFYQLIDTATSAILLPSSVTYNSTNNTAKLTFAANLPSSTHRLRIGTSLELAGALPTLATANNVGTLFVTTSFNGSAFIGDNQGQDANDVDLYRLALSNAGTINVSITPQAGLDTAPRLFDGSGTLLAAAVVNNGIGVADTLTFAATAGTYYLGVSSNGNVAYSPVTGAGATGGATTGYYSLNISTNVALPGSDDNSSFSTASDLGVLGSAGQAFSATISPQATLLHPPKAGGIDEPGHRDIPAETHYLTPLLNTGTTPAALSAITIQDYFFGDVYGADPQGNVLHNAITDIQKQRTREIFEIYGRYAGIQFRETSSSGIQVVTGDLRAIDPTISTGPGGVIGLAELGGRAIMDAAENWGNSEFGGAWMETAFHEIGHTLGLGHSYDIPSIQGAGLTGESVFTGDQDFVHFLRLYASDSTDIDLYRFDVTQSGQFTAETIAQRSNPSSQLDTALVLYRQVSLNVWEVVARNDNYFSKDSYLNLRLDPGTYFVGVSSTGNTNYDPRVSDSGYGGTTDGAYTLNLGFTADPVATLTDADNTSSTNPVTARTSLDGDADGKPGGTFDFWFESGDTIFVDKSAASAGANGSIANPYNNLATALTAAASRIVVPPAGGAALVDGQTFTLSDGVNAPLTFEFDNGGAGSGSVLANGNVAVAFTGVDSAATVAANIETAVNAQRVIFRINSNATTTGNVVNLTNVSQLDLRGTTGLMTAVNIVRVAGNGGTDRSLLTPADASPYLIGRNNAGNALADGTNLNVPQGVTVMVDAGAVFKLKGAIVDAGTAAVNIDRSQAALQVLGLPGNNVFFTSFHDDSLGGDSDGVSTGPAPGQWGGLVFRQDSDSTSPANVYLNTVNQADLRYGGGQVTVNSQLQVFNPIHLVHERPSITYNTIQFSADAAISANPNSFEETPDRVGPRFHANRLTNNSINGVFVRVQTQLGSPVDKLDVSARLDDTEVTYVITENLHINGNPGGVQTVNEQQRLVVSGAPTGGTFTLSFNGQTTAPIAYNAPASVGINEVQRVSITGAPTGGTFTLGYNEVQRVTISGSPTSGSFTLTFNGQTTGAIAFNASAAAVQTALEALSNIAPGDVSVTGGPGPNVAYDITFLGTYAITNVTQMTADGSLLGGGSAPSVAVSTTTDGESTTLTYNATAAAVQNALAFLTNIGFGNVQVTGGPGPNSPFNITFVGGLAGRNVTQLVSSGTGLTGGSAPGVSVTTLTQGITSVRDALEALTTIGAGNLVVTGGPAPNTAITIEFAGAFTGANVPPITGDGSGLTGGSSPSVAVSTTVTGTVQPRLTGQLAIDPGVVVKLLGSRIELERGASQLIAEGTAEKPIRFTSLNDDTVGAGGTFDTGGNGASTPSATGAEWGGLVFNAVSRGSLDHDFISYAGGTIPIEGAFDQFNTIEIHQADVRITNSTFERNAAGLASSNRNGRGTNDSATIFVRGAQPIIVNNILRNNAGNAVSINANSQSSDQRPDPGRTTGTVQNFPQFDDNSGPLVRLNQMELNAVNAMRVRGEELTVESVWDDTDIVHVLSQNVPASLTDTDGLVAVGNHHTFSGLRLESDTTASLVVKLSGANAGFTANGTPLDIDDRVGGTVQVVGTPGYPVVMTSLADCSVGAGFKPDGQPQTDTLSSGACDPQAPQPGDWRSVLLDQYSNDRNVSVYNEREATYTAGQDVNASPVTAEVLGVLAPNEKSGDDIRRLGFEVHGFIAADDATDVDVYSFTGTGGTEIWVDVDRTSSALDTMVELIDANGTVLARSLDNATRFGSASTLVFDMTKDVDQGGDYYSTNPKDAGVRLVLPGAVGQSGTYYLRVRSQPISGNENSLEGGLTSGRYQMQVRLRQRDEKPGSVVTFAELRYGTNGVEVRGLPAHSPLAGEITETTADNNAAAGAQDVGNLLAQDRNTISVAGNLSAATDVDFYRLLVDYRAIQQIPGSTAVPLTWATTFDVDYTDGLARPDTTIAVFDEAGRLVLVSRDSNVFDDQAAPGQGSDLDDLSRGSAGKLDPFIGSVQLAESIAADDFYNVAVTSNRQLPSQLDQTFNPTATTATTRLEPVNSVTRVVEDHIGFNGYTSNSTLFGGPVLPTTPELFDISTSISLSAHVRAFNLSDVTLFVTNNGSLIAVDPFNGTTEYIAGGYSITPMSDLGMRSDGALFGYASRPGVANTAGTLVTIDPGTGQILTSTNDAIPDAAPGFVTDTVTAFAWQQFQSNSSTYDNLFYAVVFGGSSILCRADPISFVSGLDPTQAPYYCRGPITGAGVTGLTGGMAFLGNQLFGVSTGGQLYRIAEGSGNATLVADLSTATGTGFLNAGEGFNGLAVGPQNLAGGPSNQPGFYANMLFALTSAGRLVALDTTGVPQAVFDSDNDGLADATSVTTANGTGLAFSPLDINLWHPTTSRGGDPGHGINAAFDNSRTPGAEIVTLTGGSSSRNSNEGVGGASFYFGLEELSGSANANYFRYAGVNGQYGVVRNQWQDDLTTSTVALAPAIGSTAAGESGNYNLPGGAYGSLLSDPFSLQGYSRNDKPTLYFNYFLETQDSNPGDDTFRDAARVFVSRDGGSTFELLATNHSFRSTAGTSTRELPAFSSVSVDADNRFANQQVQELFDNTGVWRQARIDLANYAGEASLMFRFDFTTAGRMLARPGENALPNTSNFGNAGSGDRSSNNDFEGFYIDDLIVGFAERGEMVTGSAANVTTFFQTPTNINPGAPTEQLAGPYQLEIRRGTKYAVQPQPNTLPQIIIAQTFDTNDRMADAITITAPAGAVIIDGQQFSVSDGTTTRVFEFDNGGTVSAGSLAIQFSAADTAETVAQRILSAILSVPGFGVNGEVLPTSNRVQLIGATNVSPVTVQTNINISLNLTAIAEDGSQTATGTVTRDVATNQLLTVTLTVPTIGGSGDANDIILTTTTVTIPANQVSANFFVFGNEDAIFEGTETVIIQASAPGFAPVFATIDVIDNDTPQISVSIVSSAPSAGTVVEGSAFGTAVATISRNTTTAVPLTVTVASLDPSELLVPAVLPGAPINEVEPNNTLATAQNVDSANWSTLANANIGDATTNTSTTIPHITINGTGNGTFDYYSFTVSNAGDRGIFDIDATNAAFNSQIFLYDSTGNLLAQNDDSLTTEGQGGSTAGRDSFLEFTFTAAGTYILGVAEFFSTGSFGGIVGNAPDLGDSYQLQISVQNHAIPATVAGAASTTVTIPAGAASVNVPLIAVQDLLDDTDQTVTLTAFASGHFSGSATVVVQDSGPASFTLNVVAASVSESAGPAITTGTVSINLAPSSNLVVNLTSNDTSEVTVPATVTILAGQTTSAPFAVNAVDDLLVDGTQTVTVTATFPGVNSGSDTLQVTDDATDTIPLGTAVWTEQGPAPGVYSLPVTASNQFGGAAHALAVDPTDANRIYVGGVNGGVWRTTNGLASSPTWTPLTDSLPALSIGAVEFDPTDATRQRLIAGIGKYSSFGAVGSALNGLLLTTNGGTTWTQLTNAILLGENFSSVAARGNILLAASDSTWGGGGGSGLFRSTDNGTSFSLISGAGGSGLPAGNVSDVVGDPLTLTTFYAAVVGGASPGVYRSLDSGATWSSFSTGLTGVGGTTTKIELAVHHVGATTAVFAGVVNGNFPASAINGLFRSLNGGSFTALDVPAVSPGGQGVVHFAMAADPSNSSLVYVGGDSGASFVSRVDASQPAGSQSTSIVGGTFGSPHADVRDMFVDPSGNLVLVGDGGIYRLNAPSTNGGSWTSPNGNLNLIEAHDAAYDTISNITMVALQDNGTVIQTAPGSLSGLAIFGNDGGDVEVDNLTLAASNQSIRYYSSQNLGGFRRSIYDNANNLVSTTVINTATVTDPQFRTPVELNAVNPQRLMIGGANSLYESPNQGNTINQISNTIGVNAFDGTPLAYGGERLGVPNQSVLYVGFGNQVFVRTAGAGAPTLASPLPAGAGQVRDIALDPDDWMVAYVADDNQVFRTTDAGATWSDVTGTLVDSDIHALVVVNGLAGNPDRIFVGGRTGVNMMQSISLGTWGSYGAGLPRAITYDLDYDATDDVLLAGTFGRGAWTTGGTAGGTDLTVTVLAPNPTTFSEAAGNSASIVRVSRFGTTGNLTVTLNSSDASELTLNGTGTASISVTIPNGQSFVDVPIDAVNDTFGDGTQTVFITATAGGFNSVSAHVDVTDNDPVLNLTVGITPTFITETGNTTFTVTRTGSTVSPLVVSLTSSDTTEATVPATATILAGQPSVTLTGASRIFGVFDGIVDGTQTSIITASAAGYESVSDTIDVTEQTFAFLALNIGAFAVLENAGAAATTATLTISTAPTSDLTVFLLSSDPSEATVPASVVIPAGQTAVTFNVAAQDEFFNDGTRTVTITAYAPGFFAATDQLDVIAVDGANTAGIDSYNRLGDLNLPRDQGQLQVANNIIRDVSQVGILIDAGTRDSGSNSPHPGSVINTPTLNNARLVPGVLVQNNVVANFAQVGIRFSGDPNTGVVPTAPVPFGKVVNNTVFGGSTAAGIGFEITDNASPTLMNNIVSNTTTAITIDASSASTVHDLFVFKGNTALGSHTLTTKDINLTQGTDPLFINPGTNNFYLAPGSLAIDSSLNSLADRPAIVAVTSPLGIPQSPLFAPDFDLYGQLRVDDPNQASFSGPGLGSNVFKDRGAVERADFVGPFAEMVLPEDNDLPGLDLDPTTTVIHIDNPTLLTQFVLGLRDAGIGIDDALVNSSQFTLRRNGTLMVLGTDYLFAYNANTNEVNFTSPSTFPLDNRYTIQVDNTSSSGVKDFAGNSLQNNQANGTTLFTILVTDGGNDAPVNSIPGAQSMNEDTNLVFSSANSNLVSVSDSDAFLGTNMAQVTLTVTNGTMTLGSLTGLSFTFNDANGQGDGDGISDPNMNFRGTFTAINAALAGMFFTPNANFNGTAVLTITTNDLGNFGPPPSFPATDTDTITITVVAVNDAPTLDAIANLNILEDSGTQTVNLTGITIGPANEAPQTLTVTATSSDTSIVPNPTVTYTSANPTGTLMLAPLANASGTVTITVTVTDNGGTANGGADTFVRTFTVTVTPVNDAPSFNSISDQTLLEDFAPTNVAITGVSPGGGPDEAGQTITFTAVSSNTSILPNPTVTGSGSTRTMTFTPAANAYGTVTVTVTAQDSGGVANGGIDSFSRTFTVTVTPVNDAPTLDPIANLPISPALLLEDAAPQTVNLSGISVGPTGSAVTTEAGQNLTVTATSSNTAIIPNPTVTYTSADPTGTLTFTPAPNAVGTATITVQVRDNGGTANGGSDTFTRTFTVTITPVNDAPVFDPVANLTVLEDPTPSPQTISITGVGPGGGADEVGQSITFTATSSNTALIPNATVTGTGSTRTLNFSPVADANGGPVTITLTATDSGGTSNGGFNQTTRTFTITVTAVNDAPTLNAIPSPAAILEDAGQQTINLSGITIGPANEAPQTLTVTATSSNTGLIPNPTVTYTSANPTGTLTYTPVADAFGTATITVQVRDDGATANGGADTITRTFTVTVTGVNDAPTIDAIAPVVTNEDSGVNTVNLTGISIGPANEAPQTLTITATSNNTAVVPNPTVTYTSPNATGTLSFTPVLNANGVATVTVTVTDSGGTANGGANSTVRTFTVTVNAVNDAPVNSVPGTQTTNDEDPVTFSQARGNLISISDLDAANANVRLTLFPTNGSVQMATQNGLTLVQGDGSAGIGFVFDGTLSALNAALNGLIFRPATDFHGTATLQVTTNDLGNTGIGGSLSDSDTINITVNDVNDAPINNVPAVQTLAEDGTRVFNTANGNLVSITDVDARSGTLRVVLTASNGRLTLGQTTNLTFLSGDGTLDSSMSFTGTLANLNAALNGLTFTPTANFNGSASFTITTDDQGNSGSGSALSDTDTVFLTVTPVNDAPTIGAAANLRIALSGQPFSISHSALLAALSGIDVDGDTIRFRVTEVINGSLTKNGTSVVPGVTMVGPNEQFDWTPPSNVNATLPAFRVQAVDSSGVSATNTSVTTATISIDVAAIRRYLRAYNPRTDYHFFTTSQGEFDNAVRNLGYRDETTGRPGFAVATGPAPGAVLIYRLYNTNNNRHYYTIDTNEKNFLVNQLKYRDESSNVQDYLWPTFQDVPNTSTPDPNDTMRVPIASGPPGTTTIFRLYNNNNGTHLLTESAAQRDAILSQFPGIWVRHADFGYTFPVSASGQPPVTAVARRAPSAEITATVTKTSGSLAAINSSEPALAASGLERGLIANSAPRVAAAAAANSVGPAQPIGRTVSSRLAALTPDDAAVLDGFWQEVGRQLEQGIDLSSELNSVLAGN